RRQGCGVDRSAFATREDQPRDGAGESGDRRRSSARATARGLYVAPRCAAGDPGRRTGRCLSSRFAPGPRVVLPSMDVAELVSGVLDGDRRAVARAISLVEDGAPELATLSAAVFARAGRAVTVGLTGAPG